MFKYEVMNRGREGNGRTWRIENLDTGEITHTNHIELKVPVKTIEKDYEHKGFGMECKGVLVQKEHPSVGKFIVVEKE